MTFHKLLIMTLLTAFSASCGNGNTTKTNLFDVEIINTKKRFVTSETVEVQLKNKKNTAITGVTYFLNDKEAATVNGNTVAKLSLADLKLGTQIIKAAITYEDGVVVDYASVTVVSSIKPKLYTYKILETYPHDMTAYTQGLEFVGDDLYESTGRYKISSLRQVDLKTGKVLKKIDLASQYFGEGLTVMGDNIYQLTWKENVGFIYNKETLEKTGQFAYGTSKEGWGLCNDGNAIFKSDGTEKIWTLDATTQKEQSHIEVYTNTSKINTINELEWVEGRIYANIYQKDAIAIVDPTNGAVEGVINLKGLKAKVTQHAKLDVLNGIAYKGEPNILYITGKNWDKLFKIEVIEK